MWPAADGSMRCSKGTYVRTHSKVCCIGHGALDCLQALRTRRELRISGKEDHGTRVFTVGPPADSSGVTYSRRAAVFGKCFWTCRLPNRMCCPYGSSSSSTTASDCCNGAAPRACLRVYAKHSIYCMFTAVALSLGGIWAVCCR